MSHLSSRKAALAVFLVFFACGCSRNSINIATRAQKKKTAPPILERMRMAPIQPFANMLQTIPLERDRIHMHARWYWPGYIRT